MRLYLGRLFRNLPGLLALSVSASLLILVLVGTLFYLPISWRLFMVCDVDAHYQGYSSEDECYDALKDAPEINAWGFSAEEVTMLEILASAFFIVPLVAGLWELRRGDVIPGTMKAGKTDR